MKPDVLGNAIDKNVVKGEKVIFLTPKGKIFNQKLQKNFHQKK